MFWAVKCLSENIEINYYALPQAGDQDIRYLSGGISDISGFRGGNKYKYKYRQKIFAPAALTNKIPDISGRPRTDKYKY